jgi:hypothetical protein
VPSEPYLGYLKYSGALVDDGMMDARKSAQALLGFDQSVRFFVGYQDARLKLIDYEMPVRIRQGSWEALIPVSIGQWLTTAVGLASTAYMVKAAHKMAEHDFQDVSLAAVFKKALRGMQWTVRIGKHLGDSAVRKFHHLKWRRNNAEVGIRGPDGSYLYVPRDFLDMYIASNPNLLEKNAALVEEERTLVIGVLDESGAHEEKLPKRFKYAFTPEDEGDEMLFPELEHGMQVSLDGDVTRGNETSNTLGFKYRDHILTCHPVEGSVVRFKSALFRRGRIHGTINRLDDFGRIGARKPRIEFTDIESFEGHHTNLELFPSEER